MNSKQRRIDKRQFRYYVSLTSERRNENGYNTMWDWCVTAFGNSRKYKHCWRESWRHIGTEWQFTTEESATLFALRWK